MEVSSERRYLFSWVETNIEKQADGCHCLHPYLFHFGSYSFSERTIKIIKQRIIGLLGGMGIGANSFFPHHLKNRRYL